MSAADPSPAPVPPAGRASHVALTATVVLFAGLVAGLMVTDVWDETRGLQLIRDHDVAELVAGNWTTGDEPGVVLFRPLPMLAVTAVAKAAPSWRSAWGALRILVAGALLAAALVLGRIARLGGGDPWPRVALVAGVLLSASGVLAASWFAMAFDVLALLLVTAGIALALRGHPVAAGLTLAAALLCKESALIALPVAALVIAARAPPAGRRRLALVAAAGCAVALGLRAAVVPPGSAQDLHSLSPAGVLDAMVRLPAALWWQVSDPPSLALGWLLVVVSVAGLRSWRAVAAALATLALAALLYGQMVHLGPSPLLDADAFAPRLYLVPGAVLLLLVTVAGRRWLPVLLLVPLLWGGVLTSRRQLEFQRAYQRVQSLAAEEAGELQVDCALYRRPFVDRRRGLALGPFPAARWRLERDGRLVDRSPGGPR